VAPAVDPAVDPAVASAGRRRTGAGSTGGCGAGPADAAVATSAPTSVVTGTARTSAMPPTSVRITSSPTSAPVSTTQKGRWYSSKSSRSGSAAPA
jgi:hypothetical protein